MRRALLWAFLAGTIVPFRARAQTPSPAVLHAAGAVDTPRAGVGPAPRQPSPFLASDHWAAIAARRLHAVGLVPLTYEPGALRAPRLVEVAAAFAWATEHGPDDATRQLAARYLELLQQELGTNRFTAPVEADDAPVAARAFVSGAGVVGGEIVDGLAGTGSCYAPGADWTGAVRLEDRATPLGGVRAIGALGRRIGFGVDAEAHTDGVDVDAAYVVLDAGFVGFWAGRRQLSFGPGWGGTIALGDDHSFTGAGMYFAEGARLPWLLRYLGPVRFEAFLSRVENGDSAAWSARDPFFGAARLSSNLHPRFSIGATRAVMFGGDNAPPASLGRVWRMIIGDPSTSEGGAWSNEVFAWDIRWRPPIGRLPLLLYTELGFDDASGAFYRAPAVVAGLDLAMIPGAPALGAGVEHVYFSRGSFKNPIWYRNYALRGGWSNERRPLGHPIGGHGRGWLAHASIDALDARLRLRATGFRYVRGIENLFAPERRGTALGWTLDAAFRATPRLELAAEGRVEDGAAWQEVGIALRGVYRPDR